MTLVLRYREVARANIEKFDQLGGFGLSADECLYHYGDGRGCAIGICDVEHVIPEEANNDRVHDLAKNSVIVADDMRRVAFLQLTHDYRAQHVSADFPMWINAEREIIGDEVFGFEAIPACVFDLVKEITCWEDLTPDLYREIMRRIAEEP